MNRTAKALLIPVAALAVTMTGSAAFSRQVLASAGLNDDQIDAFQVAQELRLRGNKEAARDTLVDAGIDDRVMRAVSSAMQRHKQQNQNALQVAVSNHDYEAFQKAIEGSPLADIINTHADFERFAEASSLRDSGNQDAAAEIMHDLGMTQSAYATYASDTRAA